MTNNKMPESIATLPKPEHKQSSGFFLIMVLLHNSINWLTSQLKFTEEDLEKAGVYLPNQRYK